MDAIKTVIDTEDLTFEVLEESPFFPDMKMTLTLIRNYLNNNISSDEVASYGVLNASWNSTLEIDYNALEQHLIQLVLFYLFDIIDFNIYRANIRLLQQSNLLTESILILLYLVEQKKKKKLSGDISYLNFIQFCSDLGVKPLLFSKFQQVLKKEFGNYTIKDTEVETAEKLEKAVRLLSEKSQYIAEFASSIPNEVLLLLDLFVKQDLLSELSYHKLKEISNKIKISKKLSLAEFQRLFEETIQEAKFPFVPVQLDPVLKPHISNVEAKPINAAELSSLPKDQITEFASIKAYSAPRSAQKVRITFLGGGGIGNMGILVQHNNNAILLDAGMSVANYNIPRWHPALRFVKAILVTHAHLDHTGALPYFITPENGKRWYGSINTKTLTELLLFNTSQIIDEINVSAEQLPPFYSAYLKKSNLINLFNVFHPLKPKKTVEISPGFSVTPYPSSHLFGSYSYEIEVFDKRILFTGDFSLNPSALHEPAKLPTDCDVTIFDGTYYNREREKVDPDTIILEAAETTSRLIIPSFSLGRAQEMLARLERYRITRNKTVKVVGLAAEVTKRMAINGKYKLYRDFSDEEFSEGDIVIAGNGMLQGGIARKLLEETREDNNTGVLICGYQAPNTLGYALKTSNPVATTKYNQQIFIAPISGHSSAKQLDNFIAELKGKRIMVHTPENVIIKKEHKDSVIIPKYYQTVEI